MKNLILVLLLALILGCSSDSKSGDAINIIPGNNSGNNDNPNPEETEEEPVEMSCIEFQFEPKFDTSATFPPWRTSPYHLPFKVGERYLVNQGNTSGFGHSGFWRFGYDFDMPVGTEIYAARSGTVVYMFEDATDGVRTLTNLITIEHQDGTVALYSHLTRNGSFVEIGDEVQRGDLIGLSGDTGNTGGLPHLHFSVHPCPGLPGLPDEDNCPTMPITFVNTEDNPDGLGTGECYTAE